MKTQESILDMLFSCYENQKSLLSACATSDLEKLACNPDSEIRAWVAKTLVNDSTNKVALDQLCKLAKDTDPSVRVEAIDSLSEFYFSESLQMLKDALCDTDYLVRGYAAIGVAYVGEGISPLYAQEWLRNLESIETEQFVLTATYEGLYILGGYCYLDRLIAQFDSDDYHIQCAVLNALDEILDMKSVHRIYCFLKTIDCSQFPSSVTTLVEKLLVQCYDILNKGKCSNQ